MSVRKLHESWWVDFSFAGSRYRLRCPVNTREAAREYESRLRLRLLRGESVSRPAMDKQTFAEISTKWLEGYIATNNQHSDYVAKKYALLGHVLPFFGKKLINQVGIEDIENYKTKKFTAGLLPSTINNHLNVIAGCLRRAVEWGYLKDMPHIKRMKRPEGRLDFLTEEQCISLIAAVPEGQSRTLVIAALHTGMRIGELCGLEWDAVDFKQRLITVRQAIVLDRVVPTKNKRIRHVPMTDDLISVLNALPGREGYVFHHGGQPLTTSIVRRIMWNAKEKIGIPNLYWHMLRHTFASTLTIRGVPIRVVQDLLGHATIVMTQRYAHLSASSTRSAIDAISGLGSASEATKSIEQPTACAPSGVGAVKQNIELIHPVRGFLENKSAERGHQDDVQADAQSYEMY